MNLQKANKVIKEYETILENRSGIIFPISSLRFTKSKIKEAIYSYYTAHSIIDDIDAPTENQLKMGYVALAYFIKDDKAKTCLEFENWINANPVDSDKYKLNMLFFPKIRDVMEIQDEIKKDSGLLLKEFQEIRRYSKIARSKVSSFNVS